MGGVGLTVYGVTVLTFMMVMYALEGRGKWFVLAFALGCALSSSYGFASGAWPFGVIEAIWCLIAVLRFVHKHGPTPAAPERG
jgi:hypothetical protein